MVSEPGSRLTVLVDAKQIDVVSPWQVVLHVRRVPEFSERQGNPSLRGDLMVRTLFEGRIVGYVPKVPN